MTTYIVHTCAPLKTKQKEILPEIDKNIKSLSTTAITSKVLIHHLRNQKCCHSLACPQWTPEQVTTNPSMASYDNHDLVDCGFYVVIQTVDNIT